MGHHSAKKQLALSDEHIVEVNHQAIADGREYYMNERGGFYLYLDEHDRMVHIRDAAAFCMGGSAAAYQVELRPSKWKRPCVCWSRNARLGNTSDTLQASVCLQGGHTFDIIIKNYGKGGRMMINGWIMSGDTAVASFYGRIVTPILPERCPLCFQKGGDLELWLESRAIDRHRTNSRILKRILRLGDTSDLNTALHVHGATITDNYWVKTEDEAGLTWADVGFRENYFADLALSGRFSSIAKNYTPEELRTATPELTNIGSYEKCWRQQDGHWVMVKSGTPEEHFSEIFTAALGKHLGYDMAEYMLDGAYVISKDFTEGRLNFEPMANLVQDNEEYNFNYDVLQTLDPSLLKPYLDILFMDALVFNVDRHTQNYGLLRSRETGAILSMAPNFDNNMALISRGYASDLSKIANPLIWQFQELLQEKNIQYAVPTLTKKALETIVNEIMPDAEIRRDYVVRFVWQNYERLCAM